MLHVYSTVLYTVHCTDYRGTETERESGWRVVSVLLTAVPRGERGERGDVTMSSLLSVQTVKAVNN